MLPRDPYAGSVRNVADHGEDARREQFFRNLMIGTPRPLTMSERWASAEDPGTAPRVYAPAWERVRKPAMPWDAEILEAGRSHTITAEAALHPGDRSDPGEVR
jgi:hypothetical protein